MIKTPLRQNQVILGLERKDAYPHKVLSSVIKVEETHISWIFLTGLYAYKVKKEVKFGKVLNFSSLRLRKKFCQKEVAINQALCSDMYKGVVKIVKQNGNMRIANLEHKGTPLEYAVKMLEIPQKFRMDNLIAANRVGFSIIKKLTEILVKFHFSTLTNAKIKRYGQPRFMKKKIRENFETLAKLDTANQIVHSKFQKRLNSFITCNKPLFYKRIGEDKIREIHGDLYLRNIFILRNNSRFYLYDRLEFNDSLRYADIAEDVAHLSMDLDYYKRNDLRRYFISKYIERSNDNNLQEMLYFLMCYKACVRAKVSLFRAKTEIISEKRRTQLEESKDLLELAGSYLEWL
jgi:aminoglycoside phosphotransferase family enzyme